MKLLLYSGGINSTVALYKFKDVDCLFIDYGQRSAKMQREFALYHCKKLNKKLVEIKIPSLGKAFYDSLGIRPNEPIVHRNVILLSIALTYAKERKYDEVIFATASEECLFEKDKPLIISTMKKLAEIYGVKLSMPFVNLSKSIIVKMGAKQGIDLGKTYSCFLGHKYHCGVCSECQARKIAFKEAGVKDETVYLR
ncbi:7-cyano-7-deazaguanine synthase [Acidianus sp. HS-5]|uniref:7-cyano-7-deazaguanine synthase n=1 Tax=Acidianus sp. HS-5 TaxID=2886040 RepID=UPI001F1B5FD6|nr:7-cyano-7-deazaguanine synthase [Acidianus sp. HS-5]BDC17657.1 7-cyano-7-deazaguanine synthase [Acidianus sp. HS-5]